MQAYLEDAFGDVLWVERPDVALFVKNIETAFTPIPKAVPAAIFPTKMEVVSEVDEWEEIEMEEIGSGSLKTSGLLPTHLTPQVLCPSPRPRQLNYRP